MIEITINNKKYFMEKNLSVLQACEHVHIIIPRFCYHESLSIAGNCRMCLVEIEKSPKPVAACAMPLNPGMVIFTDTPLVKKAREAVLEFLLINHPLDCPICDQAGECDLQDLTLNYGSDRTRFFDTKHSVEDKNCGPIIKTIMTRCIHCTRCIRFLTEIAGLEIFGALGRGESMEIGPFFSKFVKTELSGNLVDLCPVGALTSKPYAFLSRNWELKKIETIDCLDAFGSNIVIHTRNNPNSKSKLNLKDQILRVVPKFQSNLNEYWLSDKSRYSLDGLFFNRTNQIITIQNYYTAGIFVKKYIPVDWTAQFLNDFLTNFRLESVKKYKTDNFVVANLGKILSIEEIFFFFKFFKLFGFSNYLIENVFYNFKIDLPIFYKFNSTFLNIENADLLFLIYTNPRFDSAMLNIKIRKQFFNKELLIFYIGVFQAFTYPIIHLGQSLKVFLNLIEGKHKVNLFFRNAKNPLFIISSDFGIRKDALILQDISFFLSKKCFLFLKNFIGFNILHKNITQINLLELGVHLNSFSNLYKFQICKNNLFFNYNIENFLNCSHNFCNLQAFNHDYLKSGNNNTFSTGFIIPINTLYERDALTLNTEGFVQKIFKSITPLTNNRNGDDFLRAILILKNISNSKKVTLKEILFENPFVKKTNVIRKTFKFSNKILNIQIKKISFILQNKQPVLKHFFKDNFISKHSKIMAECNLFYNQKYNFL